MKTVMYRCVTNIGTTGYRLFTCGVGKPLMEGLCMYKTANENCMCKISKQNPILYQRVLTKVWVITKMKIDGALVTIYSEHIQLNT